MDSWECLPQSLLSGPLMLSSEEARGQLRLWSAVPRLRGCTREEWQSCLERDSAVWRESRPVHISTSAVVFCRDPVSGECVSLLLWHLKAQEWVYPGGHADGDWNFLRSALREVQEETALSEGFRLHARPGVPAGVPAAVQRIDVGTHAHFDAIFYLECAAERGRQVAIDVRESGSFQWWSKRHSNGGDLPLPTQWALDALDTIPFCVLSAGGAL